MRYEPSISVYREHGYLDTYVRRCICRHLHNGTHRKRPRDFRRVALRQNENGDQYVHLEPGRSGFMFPDWVAVPDCDDDTENVGIRILDV